MVGLIGWDLLTDKTFNKMSYLSKRLLGSKFNLRWKTKSSPIASLYTKLAYGEDKFVASDNGELFYSSDGINWSLSPSFPIPDASGTFIFIAYGSGIFVSFMNQSGSSNATDIVYSNDGLTWVKSANPLPVLPPYPSGWTSITYGGGRFVALASACNVAAYSNDGLTWTQTTISQAGWEAVTYGGGRFVAVAVGSSKAMYSNDGVTWIETVKPFGQERTIAYGNGKFISLSYNQGAIYSLDGITWAATGSSPGGLGFTAVTYGRNMFVAVKGPYFQYLGNYAAYSYDGINWVTTPLPLDLNMRAVVYGKGRFIAPDANGIIAYTI